MVKGISTPFTYSLYVKSAHVPSKEKYSLYRNFLKRFAMTLTFDLETYIQVFQK